MRDDITMQRRLSLAGSKLRLFPGLSHIPLVPHIYVSNRVSIGSDNGLSPIRRQAII